MNPTHRSKKPNNYRWGVKVHFPVGVWMNSHPEEDLALTLGGYQGNESLRSSADFAQRNEHRRYSAAFIIGRQTDICVAALHMKEVM